MTGAILEGTLSWQYADYGTIRIGGVERPASLFGGHRRWTRDITVPPGGARYEAVIGAIDATASLRLWHGGLIQATAQAPPGTWARAFIELPPDAGPRVAVKIEIETSDGHVAAWGGEQVVAAAPAPQLPDVIVIALDTVRADQLTPYTPSLATTPNLASFARESIVFDRAISTSSWTVSSHATLFTGRFLPDSLGYTSRIEPGEQTLTDIFKARGYRTFGVSGGPFTDPRWGLHQGFDEYVMSRDRENARAAIDRTIEWMDGAGMAPRFVFLNLFDAHDPLALSPEVRRLTGVTLDVPTPLWYALDVGNQPITPALRQRLLTAYRAELTSIDAQLARLFDHLRLSGRWDQSLIVVWSDHGQLLGEHGFVGHAYSLEEELLRVPLIVKPPLGNELTPGRYPWLIQNDDLFLLLQTLGGVPNVEGDRITSAIQAGRRVRALAFAKIHHHRIPELVGHRRWRSETQWAVHDGATKIVRTLEGRTGVYDLTGYLEREIPFSPAHAPLLLALERFRARTDAVPSLNTVAPLTPAELERLRALGYVQ